jgi:hypothetical protein
MKTTQRTIDLLSLAAAFGAVMIVLVALHSCAPRAYSPGPNPLDFPGDEQAEAAALHAENVKAIRGTP